ncbi:RNase H domain [Carpediemonas membranifera]|uniref:RNase H domain n=1 Tax=Carpediemonas membranifera TaxID=201153 RepID=A0A8J6E226_9EUKA|nr:RNase H domain [Carpediemonas membranifera]|eukprot:KAG9391357.1 RNase H domain [Carpediemonas membranifera]
MRSPTLVSPIFTIPKSLAETRLIHDLRSLNAVSSENRTFRLHGIKRALATIRPGDWLTRLDLTKGYYQVGVRPADRTLLGFIVDGRPYAFRVLPFGWKAAPFHFQRIMLEAGAVVARRFPGVNITIYLDDWLFSGRKEILTEAMPKIIRLLTDMGLVINIQKSQLIPTQSTTFLGFVIDSLREGLKLDESKRLKYLSRVIEALASGLTEHSAARLLGNLSFASLIWPDGVAQLRPLQRAAQSLKHKYRTRIHGDARDALIAWKTRLERPSPTRSTRELLHLWGMSQQLEVTVMTDASLSGLGGIIRVPGRSPIHFAEPAPQGEHITLLEFRAINAALERVMQNHQAGSFELTVYCDSRAAVAWLNRQGSTKAPPVVDEILRELLPRLSERRISVRAVHSAGHLNVLADSLSRNDRELTSVERIIGRTIEAWGPLEKDAWPLELFGAKALMTPAEMLDRTWSDGRWFAAIPFGMLTHVYAKVSRLVSKTPLTDPRKCRLAIILLVSDARSPTAMSLRHLTQHRLYFRIHSNNGVDFSEITPLQADKTFRLVALFIPLQSLKERSEVQC